MIHRWENYLLVYTLSYLFYILIQWPRYSCKAFVPLTVVGIAIFRLNTWRNLTGCLKRDIINQQSNNKLQHCRLFKVLKDEWCLVSQETFQYIVHSVSRCVQVVGLHRSLVMTTIATVLAGLGMQYSVFYEKVTRKIRTLLLAIPELFYPQAYYI